MIKQNSLALYKNKPALVTDAGEKINIKLQDGSQVKVREKDIFILHEGPLTNLNELENTPPETDINEVWELTVSFVQEGTAITLKDIADLAWNEWTAKSAWNAYLLLADGLYFSGSAGSGQILPRPKEDIEAEIKKRSVKQNEAAERTAFIDRLKETDRLKTNKLILPEDEHFLQDVKALAMGLTEKSRTMHDAGLSEEPTAAHKLLLETGVWTPFFNPYPSRFDVSTISAKAAVPPLPDEDREDLSGLDAFAVDSVWSEDPDDAVSIKIENDGCTLFVHIADPTASIIPNSDADIEARSRGTTFYTPEGTFRMISEEALPVFALGLSEISPALSFIIKIDGEGKIINTEIVRSKVHITRLSYEEADENIKFQPFFDFAERNIKRRSDAGAVFIDFPEIHITVKDCTVDIYPQKDTHSAIAVRECMLLAGEAAAGWALKNKLPFPFVSQETGDLPANPLDGLAGAYQLRRCMRPRTLSCKPGLHWGLGLDIYTQVTSPLRRYTDLLAHQQIRAFLLGKPPVETDELLARIAQSDRGAISRVHAERASRAYWIAVYLSDKIDSVWDAVFLDRKGPLAVLFIPKLGLEVQTALPHSASGIVPNETVKIKLKRVRLEQSEVHFTAV
ncbi:ribonuclease II [Spirochaetia bacterium]|nr:ribonuclease II [Spirochaetia bacterium]